MITSEILASLTRGCNEWLLNVMNILFLDVLLFALYILIYEAF
jgi:hypothetical protein